MNADNKSIMEQYQSQTVPTAQMNTVPQLNATQHNAVQMTLRAFKLPQTAFPALAQAIMSMVGQMTVSRP